MSSFSRLFKARKLKSFLAEGLDLLQGLAQGGSAPSCLALTWEHEGEDRIIVAGQPPTADETLSPPDDALQSQIVLPGTSSALLWAAPAPDAAAPMQQTLEFLGRRLQELAESEAVCHSVGQEALEQYRESSVLQRAVVNLNTSMKSTDMTASLAQECIAAGLPSDYCLVFGQDDRLELLEKLNPDAREVSVQSFSMLPQSELYKQVKRGKKSEVINDLSSDKRWKEESRGLRALLLAPLSSRHFDMGVLALAITERSRTFSSKHLKKASTLAGVAGISLSNAYHFEQVQYILLALIKAMATAIDARDRLTAGHSQRVAQYALGLAVSADKDRDYCPALSFSEEEFQELFYAGLLHDVGKIGVREEVLTKETRLPRPHLELIGLRLALWGEMNQNPWKELYARLEIVNKAYDLTEEDSELVGMLCNETLQVSGNTITILTEEEGQRLLTPRGNLTHLEWEEIKRHPRESHRILQNIPFTTHFPNILTMVLQHHERLDGSGYPDGLHAPEITTQSRIMAIVDVYDALRQDRHYKKGLPQEMALTILRQEARRVKLDTKLVEVFCRDIDEIERTLVSNVDWLPGREFIQ